MIKMIQNGQKKQVNWLYIVLSVHNRVQEICSVATKSAIS
jgi:hypothetical protein